jgi:hypothetical protein
MVVLTSILPGEIIKRITHEWARIGGVRIAIKDLQNLDSKTVVSICNVSAATDKRVILAELKCILSSAQAKADAKGIGFNKYDFSMEMDIMIGETLPEMNLHLQNVKLCGQDLTIFNRLNRRAQYARKIPRTVAPYDGSLPSLAGGTLFYAKIFLLLGTHPTTLPPSSQRGQSRGVSGSAVCLVNAR